MLQAKIKQLLREQGKKHKDLCDAIEMSDGGMRKIYSRDSCEISVLKKIAAFFDVKIIDLLDESDVRVNINNNKKSFNPGQNETETIQELTQIIDEQRKRIDYLTDKLLNMPKK